MGQNFKELLSEAKRLFPNVRIVGCTCAGIIGRIGPNESLKAQAIMAIKGTKEYFAVSISKTIKNMSACETGVSMAQDLKNINPDINMIHCSNLLLISSFHRRDDTELLHHAKIIHDCPNLRNLSVRNAEHFDPFDHDSFSCGWNPHELALVCAVRGPDLRHFISFGDNFVGRDMQELSNYFSVKFSNHG